MSFSSSAPARANENSVNAQAFVSNLQSSAAASSSQFPPNLTRENAVADANNENGMEDNYQNQNSNAFNANEYTKEKIEQFMSMPWVETKFSALCKAFAEATAALVKARQSLDNFKAIGVKTGKVKQLPRLLCWNILSAARLTSVLGNEQFYAQEEETLRQIERDASEKIWETLLSSATALSASAKQSTLNGFLIGQQRK
jgi:hypothetical protein